MSAAPKPASRVLLRGVHGQNSSESRLNQGTVKRLLCRGTPIKSCTTPDYRLLPPVSWRRIPRAAARGTRGGKTALNDFHYAVVVGINTYPAFPGRNLQFARDDADNFEAWLVSPNGGGLPPKDVRKITAPPAREATFPGADDAYPTRTDINPALKAVTKSAKNDISTDKSARA